MEILLDQDNSEPAPLEVADDALDLLDDHGRQPFGRFIQKQELQPVRMMRAIASICCSPPDSFAPRFASRSQIDSGTGR